MSILALADRRLGVSRLRSEPHWPGLEAGRGLVPTVWNHPVDELDEVFTDLPHSDALNARVRAFEQHGKEIGGQARVLEPGCLAQAQDALVLAESMLLDHSPRRVIRVRELGEGIAERGSTLFHRAQLGRRALTPVLQQGLWISTMLGVEILPLLFLVRDYSAHPFRNQLVLRVEVAVKGHLVRLSRLGDGLNADAADSLLKKKIPSR